ncbi:GNAT superfamily N-acetyltransferase [Altererythrobacter atlanticus]|uniref:Acetyltransferase n=1 Tax=Croceibacterium atlanticum TaxID=1267766 RepID=A0A0F7KVT2_9SPHN|nr:GNAT family N-acetyltransferase [Croceibacterium atlanticum]AKH43286.1 putative acetyltransferase [Croceibacterium atlanticum]MBB5732008.1 GNAT superfamily N-acetyltransferase [Croceibacterium atlanticum]
MTIALPPLTVEMADYEDPLHAADILLLLDAYARDPMGGGEALSEDVRERLLPALAQQPGAFSLIARLGDKAVGLANCFTGFSTFAARPLVNIHDMVVLEGHRGLGIGRTLFAAVEDEARRRGACKVTLEVLSGNEPAKKLYESLGYGQYELDPAAGHALFWQKRLT